MSCGCKCSVAFPQDAVDLSAVVSVVFPVYTHLLFAYLVFSFHNEQTWGELIVNANALLMHYFFPVIQGND